MTGADRVITWDILDQQPRSWVQASGFMHLRGCMYSELNMPLISAFIERWHPETNSFHMPFGELTITLHDVWYLLRVPVEGKPVITSSTIPRVKTQLGWLLGMTAAEVDQEWRCSTIRFNTLLTRTGPPGTSPRRKATGYMMWLLGATLFMEKHKSRLSVHFLEFLEPVEEVSSYAWGTAALAYLYRQMGVASRAETAQIGGCLTLLQVR